MAACPLVPWSSTFQSKFAIPNLQADFHGLGKGDTRLPLDTLTAGGAIHIHLQMRYAQHAMGVTRF